MKTTFSLQGLLGLENLQGWSQHNLAGPVPVSGCPQRGKVSLHTVWSLLFQFKPRLLPWVSVKSQAPTLCSIPAVSTGVLSLC